MENTVQMCINKTSQHFDKSFINNNNELILEPKNNVYFRLEDVTNELEFNCKMVEWVSRHCFAGSSKYWRNKIRKMLNGYLRVSFSQDEWERIYASLGLKACRNSTIAFVQNDYDINMLPEYK